MSISRWTLAAGAVLTVMLTASFLSAPGGWTDAQAWADEWSAQWRRQLQPCPVLVGTADPGEFREALAVAASLAKGVDRAGRLTELRANLTLLDAELTESDRSLLLAMQPAMQALRNAARQAGAAWIHSPGRPEQLEVFDLMDACDALLAHAYVQRATDPIAACEQLLDGVRIATELLHGVTIVEVALGALILERYGAVLGDTLLPALPRERLQWLEQALRKVDDAIPERPALEELDAWSMVVAAKDPAQLGPGIPAASLRAWRHGFSERRWLQAVAASVVASIERRTTNPTGATTEWSVRRIELAQATRAFAAVGRTLYQGGNMDYVELEEGVRRAAAQLRLLRLAVAFGAGSELPTLRDPLGDGDLLVDVEGNVATFRSAGADIPPRRTERR